MTSAAPTGLRTLAYALMLAAAGLGCGDRGTFDTLTSVGSRDVPVAVTIELLPDLPAFKVDGRLRAAYVLAAPFAGTRDVGMVVLPAGARAASGSVELPKLSGTLMLREITTSPTVPFLCGSAGPLDPRVELAATVVLDLCRP